MELQPVKVQDCLLDKKNKKNIVDKYDSGNYGLRCAKLYYDNKR